MLSRRRAGRRARKKWGHFDPAAKIAALRKLADAQCKVYGITTPEIVEMPAEDEKPRNGFVVEGGYRPDGKIHLNFGPDVDPKDLEFQAMMATMFHEVAHHYQHTLAEKFTRHQLKPDDPLYAQAALFAANDLPGANINEQDINAHPENAKELEKGYRGQPNERHSFKTIEAMASATLKVL
jgi:hypothetical protein